MDYFQLGFNAYLERGDPLVFPSATLLTLPAGDVSLPSTSQNSSYNGTENLVERQIQPEQLGSGDYIENLIIARGGSIRSGATYYNEGDGWWLGRRVVENDVAFFIGSATGNKLTYNTTDDVLSVTGTIVAGAGEIGGWTISDPDIYSGNVRLESDTERILLGLATAPLTGNGIFIGKDGSDYEFRAGNPTGDYMHWTGSQLNIVTTTVDITSTNFNETAAATLTAGSSSDASSLHYHDPFTLLNSANSGSDVLLQIHVTFNDNGGKGTFSTNGTNVNQRPDGLEISESTGARKALYSNAYTADSGSSATNLVNGLSLEDNFDVQMLMKCSNDSTHEVYLGFDAQNADVLPTTQAHIGFLKDGATSTITNANGTTQTSTSVSITYGQWNHYRIARVGSSIYFYVNNTLLGTHTTNLPTSGGSRLNLRVLDQGAGSVSATLGPTIWVKVARTISV